MYTAKVAVAFYNVLCPGCGGMLPAPDTQFGRYMWLQSEIESGIILYCLNPDCTVAKKKSPITVPFVEAVVMEVITV